MNKLAWPFVLFISGCVVVQALHEHCTYLQSTFNIFKNKESSVWFTHHLSLHDQIRSFFIFFHHLLNIWNFTSGCLFINKPPPPPALFCLLLFYYTDVNTSTSFAPSFSRTDHCISHYCLFVSSCCCCHCASLCMRRLASK